jgi:uncharacterized integral membrane protein
VPVTISQEGNQVKLSTVLFLLIAGIITAFSIANWSLIVAPTSISLLVTSVQAPLGLILLGAVLVVSVMFLVFLIYLQTSVLIESRRHARELDAQRQLADQAEASRFTELRGHLDNELKALNGHLESVERELKSAVEHSSNSLAAYLGELEDRLERHERAAGTPGAG